MDHDRRAFSCLIVQDRLQVGVAPGEGFQDHQTSHQELSLFVGVRLEIDVAREVIDCLLDQSGQPPNIASKAGDDPAGLPLDGPIEQIGDCSLQLRG